MRPTRKNLMHPIRWVPEGEGSLLDIGCNVGEFLAHCRSEFPALRLAGVEINGTALEVARRSLPDADLRRAGADALPFGDQTFDVVTCIEVLEHIPEANRRTALAEMRRVLRPGGRLVVRVPHAGLFAWLDPDNFRFRFPRLYGRLLGRGRKDAGYEGLGDVVWHHHFTFAELLGLVDGPGWEREACRRGGLLAMPLASIACWPFYRAGRPEHPIAKGLRRLSEADLGINYGPLSYDILLALRKT